MATASTKAVSICTAGVTLTVCLERRHLERLLADCQVALRELDLEEGRATAPDLDEVDLWEGPQRRRD